jgi:hypothetical protein
MDSLTPLLAGNEWWVATLLIGLGLVLVFRFGLPLLRRESAGRKRGGRAASGPATIPPGVRLEAQPLLTKGEAALYNLMRVAVQEQFLIFAQVPVWSLVDVRAAEGALRSQVLSQIAFKRVQFVLVHPGTLRVAKVVEFEDPEAASPQRQAREQLLDAVFSRAGIPVVRLNAQREYSVAALAGLLGVEPAELDDP